MHKGGVASWCKSCGAENQKKHRIRVRYELLCKYSGNPPFCVCCKENNLSFLALDHKFGGGNIHRKKYKLKGIRQISSWAKKNNYPNIFRVLCHNCNMAEAIYGKCPHYKFMSLENNSDTKKYWYETKTFPYEMEWIIAGNGYYI